MDWRPRKQRKINAEINVVPYIEVMTVLLVIFMLTSPMLTQGVDVNLPQAGAEPVETEDEEPLVLTVDREGQYYINVGGDDRVPISREEVASRVGKVLASAPRKLLLVRGDRDASYDQVVQLMVLLQQEGATSVGLVTE
ncbi:MULTISPECIES: protein TolR [Marinobacterium]|jgi:biopolymer transport protein TolR|uniref:Tol-Pal system protein TolR n=1 Tax=Marinobacterium iners DSM 11526 TaxID=1122198 RepID=A0A1H4BCF6_9GAMM|nr:protein TolR [Marinobacterium iners]QSR35032.1 protein TolR [Marinobacterium iners]SEA45668.1 Cell division and transport-associated protein TolR [Marinobacterium iners DSM 11526]